MKWEGIGYRERELEDKGEDMQEQEIGMYEKIARKATYLALGVALGGYALYHTLLERSFHKNPPNLSWGDFRPYVVLQRTLDEDCRQAEEPKQLADEASWFHLWRQRQHSAVICSGALLFSSRVLRLSLVTLCSHKSGRCAVELYHASHLWYPPFYTSPIASSALQH